MAHYSPRALTTPAGPFVLHSPGIARLQLLAAELGRCGGKGHLMGVAETEAIRLTRWASSACRLVPVFSNTRWRWVRVVEGAIPKIRAAPLTPLPFEIRRATVASVGVTP